MQVPSFAGNQVFRVSLDDVTCFLKLASPADLSRELGVISLLGTLGVPVPVVEAADPLGQRGGVPCVLLRDAGGLPTASTSPEFAAAGPLLRRVHDVVLDGFGAVVAGRDGLHGQDRQWPDTIARRISGLQPIAAAGLAAPALLDRAVTTVAARSSLLASPAGGRLLHGDFHPRHVYARRGKITAIIDWGDATSGDPRYDLGRVLHSAILAGGVEHGFTVVDGFLHGYGDAPWLPFPAQRSESLLLYAAIFALWSMQGEFAGGSPWPPWWPAQSAALTAILDALGSPSSWPSPGR